MKGDSVYVFVSCFGILLAAKISWKAECDVETDAGPCKAHLKMYFYNVTREQCDIFVYGGCQGNGNKFYTEAECLESCGNKPPVIPVASVEDEMPRVTSEGYSDNTCKLNPDSGPCKGRFVKYFFNTLSGICDSFIYGGCFGNDNRYDSMGECARNCKPRTPSVKTYLPRVGFEYCFLPPMKGSCVGKLPKYYYDPLTKDCQIFLHGGCDGNANRFDNVVECLKSCANSESLQVRRFAKLTRSRVRY